MGYFWAFVLCPHFILFSAGLLKVLNISLELFLAFLSWILSWYNNPTLIQSRSTTGEAIGEAIGEALALSALWLQFGSSIDISSYWHFWHFLCCCLDSRAESLLSWTIVLAG